MFDREDEYLRLHNEVRSKNIEIRQAQSQKLKQKQIGYILLYFVLSPKNNIISYLLIPNQFYILNCVLKLNQIYIT